MHDCLFAAIYREVPNPEDLKAMGNFMPRIAENAEALIDYALSHIPKSKFIAQSILHCIVACLFSNNQTFLIL